jgi:hypothetical protein
MRISFETDGDLLALYVEACATLYGYQATIDGQPNAQSAASFAADQVVKYCESVVRSYQIQRASDQAAMAKNAELDDLFRDANVIITNDGSLIY